MEAKISQGKGWQEGQFGGVGMEGCGGVRLLGTLKYNKTLYLAHLMKIIFIQGKAQNMSQLNLLGQSYYRLPMAPNLNQTLLLIETNRYFAPSSQASIGHHIPDNLEDLEDESLSLDHKLEPAQNETITSTSLIKKKKTGCTCKKTKCLKMYCECFSTGKACTEDCSCYGCSNDHQHTDSVCKARELIKHKLSSSQKQNSGKGCNCKKSQCQKKYCECYNSGIACGSSCKCEDCANGQCSDHSGPLKTSKEGKLKSDSHISNLL